MAATLALFVALGGGAYAATQLPPKSVGTKQLKDRAVTPVKLAPKTTKMLGVHAYAYVHVAGLPHPALDKARTKGFASVTSPEQGVFCLKPSPGVKVGTSAPAVTAVWNSGVIDRVSAQLETDLHKCTVGQLEIYMYLDKADDATPAPSNANDFTVVLP
ncbi:MAG: hypothetical protein ACJ760_10160 [Thermoleophilaceae bacterium]